MKRISIYFVDGKSLAFTIEEEEYEKLMAWIYSDESKAPYKIKSNELKYYIFKGSIEYIIV